MTTSKIEALRTKLQDDQLDRGKNMKLNPPETAPKNAFILADFGHRFLLLAIWSEPDSAWSTAMSAASQIDGEEWEMYFETETFQHKYLRGWLPMPEIDDEGNVR